MEIERTDGFRDPHALVVSADYSPRVLLLFGIVAFIVLIAALVRRRAISRSVAFPRISNPSYRRTAIKVEEHPRGWVSYRQRDPEEFDTFRTRVLRRDRKGRATVIAVFGLRPARPAERARTGRSRVAELQTIRERIR